MRARAGRSLGEPPVHVACVGVGDAGLGLGRWAAPLLVGTAEPPGAVTEVRSSVLAQP